jgi:catechol 2,3-dioxygenase-like lactoylglutathione lyase family enzyme
MPLNDIHHVALRCIPGNIEKTVTFYQKVLGMKSANRPDLGFPACRPENSNYESQRAG